MKLCTIALVLSCVISPVLLSAPPQCTGLSFVPAACKEDLIANTFAGIDGSPGKQGKVGLIGQRGPKGKAAKLCTTNKPKKINILCPNTYDLFLKDQREIRWMYSIMHVIFGYNIDELSKNELIKLVLTQNIKIVDDYTVIGGLDEKLANLLKQVNAGWQRTTSRAQKWPGQDIHGKYIQVIKENKEKTAQILTLTGLNKKLKERVAGLAAKEKEINDLKVQINGLKETIKGSGNAVQELAAAQAKLKTIEAELKSTSDALNAKIKYLEEIIKTKTAENGALVEKLKKAIEIANNNAKVVKVVTAENKKLKLKLAENEATCKKNMQAKEAELELLKKELAALKLNCKDVDKQKLLIIELNKQIAELKKEKTTPPAPKPTPPAPKPTPPVKVTGSIYPSTDTSKPVTTIADADIGTFAKYVKNGKIVLESQMASDGTGPYMIIIRRFDGSQDFKKKFAEYQAGFGTTSGEFWLGLDAMHALVKTGKYKLRVELTDHHDKLFYANYGTFSVGAAPTYTLAVGDFTGDTYDSLKYHNGQKFSALDKDQDATSQRVCAANSGGWWYKRCQFALLTGTYHKEIMEDQTGVRWYDRRVHGRYYSWKKAVMMMKPA